MSAFGYRKPVRITAVEAGIEPGDTTESLDRKSANEMSLPQLWGMLTNQMRTIP